MHYFIRLNVLDIMLNPFTLILNVLCLCCLHSVVYGNYVYTPYGHLRLRVRPDTRNMFWEPLGVPAEEKYRTGCAEIMQVTTSPIVWNTSSCSDVQCRGGKTYTGFWGDTFYPTAGSPVSNPSKCEIYHDCSYSAEGDFMVDVNTCSIRLCEHVREDGVGEVFPSACSACRNCTIIQKNGLYYSPTTTRAVVESPTTHPLAVNS